MLSQNYLTSAQETVQMQIYVSRFSFAFTDPSSSMLNKGFDFFTSNGGVSIFLPIWWCHDGTRLCHK